MNKRIQEIKNISKKYNVDYDEVLCMFNKFYYETYLEASKTKNYKDIYDKDLKKKLYSKIEDILQEA